VPTPAQVELPIKTPPSAVDIRNDTVETRKAKDETMNLLAMLNYVTTRMRLTEKGASLVEYALLVALIAVVCIAAITLLGNSASSRFRRTIRTC
jgi:pilus assembly protein Flp/PilA